MRLRISHATTYSYEEPASYALQQVRLMPKENDQQAVLAWNISIEGGVAEISYTDQHNNHVDLINVTPGESTVRITASGEVETTDTAGIIGMRYNTAPLWHFKKQTARTRPGAAITQLAKTIRSSDSTVLLESLHALSAEVHNAVSYMIGKTYAETTAEEALNGGKGVCQDHAQIFISAARAAGVPARYVSGYLMMNDRIDQDATHAWAEAHVDNIGWVGFDISNGISPDERYVRVATGLDYSDAAPISGMRLGSGAESMIVSLQVQQ